MIRASSWAYDITGAALVVTAEVDVTAAIAVGAVDMAVFCPRLKPVEAPVIAEAVVVVGAVPRGFSVRLVGAMDDDVIAGATEAVEEPRVNPASCVELIGAANREDIGAVVFGAELAGAGVAEALIPKLIALVGTVEAEVGAPRVKPVDCAPRERAEVGCTGVG